ncbi:hypothetical protein CXF85_04910 [Colwellia sp. 75C3]|uniref:hypothetical protein n=1 Tax=Colwellia sp. 75C3 TaxID=888425 RepID=UPI000C32250E|nr:hypothetical protein [Colwellia sp. 75C3]PKG84953.1 hypothetical protein CXF85_04910 [Colwellia sp. 75C3]
MLLVQYKKWLCLPFLLFASYAFADEADEDKLQFSGFATLGVAVSDSDHHGYRKNVGSEGAVYSGEIDFKQHSLLGLQADWSIAPNVDAVYQAVIRDLPEPSLDRYTTLAFLRYEVNMNWSVRVGRTAPDIFLLTEYRDVDFSYVWATAPNEVYGIIPYRSIDGLDVTYQQRGLGGVFKTKLFTGSSEAEISGSTVVEKVKIEDVVGISFTFDHFNWLIQAKHTQVTIANEPQSNTYAIDSINQVPDFLWPDSEVFAESLLMTGQEVDYSSVSAQYYWDNWLASVELSRIVSDSDVIPKITSGYAALSYRINAHQFYSIYAFTDSNTYVFDEPGVNEVVLEELIHGITGLMNFYSANQQTISLGWRWDITNYMASSLQWNYTKIEDSGSVLWLNTSEHNEAENVNTVLLTLSTVF